MAQPQRNASAQVIDLDDHRKAGKGAQLEDGFTRIANDLLEAIYPSADMSCQHLIPGGMKGGKMKLTKPFKKAMKQAERVVQSHNHKREIHKLCAMLKEAINHG